MTKEYSIKNWLRYLIREQEEEDDSEPDMQTGIVQKTFQQQPAIDQDQYRLEGIAKNLEARKEIDVFSGGPIKCFGPRPTPGVKYQKFNSLQAQPYYGAFQRTGEVSMVSVRGDSRDEEFFNPDGSENYRCPNVVTNEYGSGQYKPVGGSTKGYYVHHWTIWRPADMASHAPPPPVIKTPPAVQQPPAPAVQEKKPSAPKNKHYYYKINANLETMDNPERPNQENFYRNKKLFIISSRKIRGLKEISPSKAIDIINKFKRIKNENMIDLEHSSAVSGEEVLGQGFGFGSIKKITGGPIYKTSYLVQDHPNLKYTDRMFVPNDFYGYSGIIFNKISNLKSGFERKKQNISALGSVDSDSKNTEIMNFILYHTEYGTFSGNWVSTLRSQTFAAKSQILDKATSELQGILNPVPDPTAAGASEFEVTNIRP